jgi:ATP-dependent DNA helicase PIF1
MRFTPRHGPEAVNRMLQDVRGDCRPFGGVTVVFGGDYQQILPVVLKGDRDDIVVASLQRSPLWNDIKVLHLQENIRIRDDPASQIFSRWLLDVGHSRSSSDSHHVNIPAHMLCIGKDDLIDATYPCVHSIPPPPPDYFLSRMILAPTNKDVDTLNDNVLQRMQTNEWVYFSADSYDQEVGVDGDNGTQMNLPIEFL